MMSINLSTQGNSVHADRTRTEQQHISYTVPITFWTLIVWQNISLLSIIFDMAFVGVFIRSIYINLVHNV